MKSTSKTTNCDSCGNKGVKIKRRYKGESYCSNCYRTWFIKKPCSQCSEINRLHKKENFAVCTTCRMSQPCIRCNGDAFKDGANTEYGRVCQVCYQNYFKAKKECFECGEFKRNISSYSKLSHNEAVCKSCFESHFMQTCPLCHRYRELVDSDKGLMCQKCHDFGKIPCENCHKLMPAGMGKRCNDCYWSQRLEHEAKLNSYLLSSTLMRQAYIEFTEWFMINKGSMTATLKHNNFIDFFVRCDALWGQIPSYESLVQEFKPNGLREHLTVLRWLINTKQVVVDSKIKAQVAEEERIINLLAKFDERTPDCISTYHHYLEQKLLMGKTSLKSIRLALQPAIDLCTQFGIEGSNTPNQEQLDGYLLVKHGQHNALYGFVMFLNKQHELSLVCTKPSKDAVLKANRGEIEQKMMMLYNQPKPLSDKDELIWLQLSMVYFHKVDIKLRALKALSVEQCDDNRMIKITFNQKEYCLPMI